MFSRLHTAALAIALLAVPATARAQAADSVGFPSAGAAPASVPDTTRYRLVEVAGNALPAQIEQEWGCREDVTAGTLILTGDGRWHLESATRETCGGRSEEERDSEFGTYTWTGSALTFLDEDGHSESDREWGDKDIDLDELASGSRAPDGALRVKLADGRTTLVFRP
jgi:hypothetical protein